MSNEVRKESLMNIDEKVILVDCDGVLVDWVYSFDRWMNRHGFVKAHANSYKLDECYGIDRAEMKRLVRMFNESANIGYIPPLRDAVKYIKKLHEEHGFVFHCITSLSLDPFAIKLRENNIKALFGETAFERIVCLDTGADKDEALAVYKDSGCLWVEDKPENAEVGAELGLRSILVEHDFTKDYEHESVTKVKTWRDIYELVA